jgi:hypothetical protein
MPQFTVTSPDGATYDVTAPDGATAQEVLDRVRRYHAGATTALTGERVGESESPLTGFRAQHPEYNDLPDAVLADKLYQKFYSDMPREQFDAKMGLTGAPAAGPWKKYQTPSDGPWTKYGDKTPDAPASGSWKLPDQPNVNGAARDVPAINSDLPPAVRNLLQGVQGAGTGLAHLAGAPVDLITLLLNTLATGVDKAGHATGAFDGSVGRITNPVGGSQQLMEAGRAITKPLTDAIGYEPVEPRDLPFGERLIYNVNDLGAQTLGFAGAINRAARAAEEGGSLLGRTVDHYLRKMAEPYAEGAANAEAAKTATGRVYEAARPYVVDQATSAGAATGLTAAQQYTDSPIAQFVAMMLGGLGGGGAVRVAESPAGAARTVNAHLGTDYRLPADAETGRYTSPYVANRARETMQGAAVNPEAAARNIGEGAEFYRDAGMTRPTSGLMSNDEGLIAVERAARTKNPVPFAQRDRAVNQGATEKIQSLSPGESISSRLFTDALKRQVTDQLDAAASKIADLEGKVADLETQAGATGSSVAARTELAGDASKRLDTAVVNKTMRPMAARQNELYRGIDPTGEVQRDVTPLLDAVRELERTVPEGVPADEVLPGKWLSTIKSLAPKSGAEVADEFGAALPGSATGGSIPFKDLNEMRPFLSKAIASARQRGDYARADSLRTIKSFIDSEAERVATEGGSAGERARAAVDYTKQEFGPLFGQGEGKNLRTDINTDDLARTNTPATETAGRFLKPGITGEEVATDLRRILEKSSSRAEGMAAARDYVLSDMAKTVGADGKISPFKLRAWIANRSGMFKAFPEIRAEAEQTLRDVVNNRNATTQLQKDLQTAVAARKATEREIGNSALSLVLDADPVVAVRNVFKSRDPQVAMREIVGRVKAGGPDAELGLRKAVADYLEQTLTKTNTSATSEGVRNTSLAELENAFARSDKVLAELYGPKEMSALQQARRAVTDLNRKGVTASAGSPTSELFTGLKRVAEIVLKTTHGGLRGGNMFRNLKLAMQTIPGLNDVAKIERIVERAMFDPELAKHLLTEPVVQRERSLWNRRLVQLVGLEETASENSKE